MLRRAAKTLCSCLFFRHAAYWERASKTKTMIALCYHRVGESAPSGLMSVGTADFERHLEIITGNRFLRPVSGEEFERLWKNDMHADGRVPLLITFDDGYRDNLDFAAPLLRKHGIPALLFVATDILSGKPLWYDVIGHLLSEGHSGLVEAALEDLIGTASGRVRRRLDLDGWVLAVNALDEERFSTALARIGDLESRVSLDGSYFTAGDIEAWQKMGMEIGGHTCSHPRLSRVSRERAVAEIRESRAILERVTGRPIRYFAYPFGERGDFTQEDERELERQGYAMGFSLLKGGNRAGGNPYAIRRNSMWSGAGKTPFGTVSSAVLLGDVTGLFKDFWRNVP